MALALQVRADTVCCEIILDTKLHELRTVVLCGFAGSTCSGRYRWMRSLTKAELAAYLPRVLHPPPLLESSKRLVSTK